MPSKLLSLELISDARLLAIVLPSLTLCTHTLLALSFILPGADLDRAYFSVVYNVLAACASILGLIGAVRVSTLPFGSPGEDEFGIVRWKEADMWILQLISPLVSAYTCLHTTTLSFVTIALVNLVIPFDFRLLNPIVPSYRVDGSSICRDIDAGFGWDERWLETCAKSFSVVRWSIAGAGLVLMVAQWWALTSVRRWGSEMNNQRRTEEGDIEKAGTIYAGKDMKKYEKTGY
jgi:hypothetical protein